MMGVSDTLNSVMGSSACVLIRGHRSLITMINHDVLQMTAHDDSNMVIASDANHNVITVPSWFG